MNDRTTVAAWITDGSLPVFSDTWRLRVSHKATMGIPTRYEGFVDPSVPVGEGTIVRERPGDQLFAEAEWALSFPDGLERFLQKPALIDADTPVVLQGFLEGKWVNRLAGTRAWRPASIANNLLARGAGIPTTIGAIEAGSVAGRVTVSYQRGDSDADGRQEHYSDVADLRGHNLLPLVQDVLRVCREHAVAVDVIDLGAVGIHAAVVNEKSRVRAALRFSGLPLPNPLNAMPHRGKERLVAQVLTENIDVRPGSPARIQVTRADKTIVGEGSLMLSS